jgi:hypothetical protein
MRGRGQQRNNNNNDNNNHTTNNNQNNNNLHDTIINRNNSNNPIINDNSMIDQISIQKQNASSCLPSTRTTRNFLQRRRITPLMHQTTINAAQQTDNSNFGGHPLPKTKADHIFRLGFRNINSLPTQRSDPKNLQLVQDIKEAQIDLMGLTEINLAWQNLPLVDQIRERFRGLFEFSKIVSANNRDKTFDTKQQSGGTMMILQGFCCSRAFDVESDPLKLGRWCSLVLRGKRGMKLRVITMYRPVFSTGPLSAYQQQRNVLLDHDIDDCPRLQILNELRDSIVKWKNQGEQLLVIGDFNESIQGSTISQFFEQLDMKELILDLHPTLTINTFSGGSTQIDGIFGTRNITPLAGGYTELNWGLKSDHRMLWVDLDLSQLFGELSTPMWKPPIRRLKCNDPRIVDSYNKLRRLHGIHNNLPQLNSELNHLMQHSQIHQLDPLFVNKFEKLETLRTEGIQLADKKCRKLRMGHVPWSPAIQLCMDRIKYLNACRLKYENGRNINSRTLDKLFRKTNWQQKVINKETTLNKLKETFNTYNLLKLQAHELRHSFLEDLAEALSDNGKGKKASIVKQLTLHESQRQLSRKIKFTLGRQRHGVSAIEFQNQQGHWEISTDKQTIENECMNENIRRFTQALDTPSLQPTQIDLIGWNADTITATSILEGTDNLPPELDESLQRLAPFLAYPPNMSSANIFSDKIPMNDYSHHWSRCREFTSTGVSGLHYGHFIASLSDSMMSELDRSLLEVSLQTGLAPKRWKRGIDVMIPKKIGSLKANQLRTIVLMEPDFNLVNKIMGKRLMANAERFQSVAPEQFGSRKRKSAINHAINKQLTIDILRQEHRAFVLILLDARSCYDRISPPVASLSMKRQGAPNNCVALMFNTIQAMEHFIRTTYGDSDISYSSTVEQPFHGVLQGNGAGPTIWALVSTPLLDRLRVKKCGVAIISMDETVFQIPAFAFVDDVDLIQELYKEESVEEAQKAVDEWSDALRATGGELVPEKCKCIIVRPSWIKDKWTYANITTQEHNNIYITNERGERIAITQCPPSSGQLALGLAFSPINDTKDEVKRLRDKAETWAENVRTGYLNRQEAWHCLQTTIMKTIDYSLAASTLTQQDFKELMKPVLQVGLPKSGICRTLSRAVVHSSIKYQGLGVSNPFWLQGIYKIQVLLEPTQVLTHRLLNISWDLLIKESGLGPKFMVYDFHRMKHLVTLGWITSIWELLQNFPEISIRHLHQRAQCRPMRFVGDRYLMHLILTNSDIQGNDLRLFNACRIYSQVELLSDLLTADGKNVRRTLWNGNYQAAGVPGYTRLSQPRPSEKSWKIWRSTLQKLLNTNQEGKLNIALPGIQYSTTDWTWYYDEECNRLYKRSNTGIIAFTISNNNGQRQRTRQKKFRIQGPAPAIPRGCRMATVYATGDCYIIDGLGTRGLSDRTSFGYTDFTTDTSTDIHDYIHTRQTGLAEEFLSELQSNRLIIMSDGSAKHSTGACAWILTSEQLYLEDKVIEGWMKVPQCTADSYRAECFGIYGGIWSLNTLIQQLEPSIATKELTVAVGCDNASAIKRSFDRSTYPNIHGTDSDFDILRSIRSITPKNVKVSWRHVKGHQTGETLDIWGQINTRADQLAGECQVNSSIQMPPSSIPLIGEEWQVLINNDKLYKRVKTQLYDHMSEQTVLPYWQKKGRFLPDSSGDINWEAIGTAMTQSTAPQRQWITKRASRECGANSVLYRRKVKMTDKCPLCHQIETASHVLQCQDERATKQWDSSLADLRKWLESKDTDPSIITALCSGLAQWQEQGQGLHRTFNDLNTHQNTIGWNGILEGCFSAQWEKIQGQYYRSRNSRKSGFKWQVELCKRIWKIPWDMWQHRNSVEHANDHQHLLQQIRNEVQQELLLGSEHDPDIERFIQEAISPTFFERTLAYQRGWLRGLKALRERKRRRGLGDRTMNNMRRVMRMFLSG